MHENSLSLNFQSKKNVNAKDKRLSLQITRGFK